MREPWDEVDGIDRNAPLWDMMGISWVWTGSEIGTTIPHSPHLHHGLGLKMPEIGTVGGVVVGATTSRLLSRYRALIRHRLCSDDGQAPSTVCSLSPSPYRRKARASQYTPFFSTTSLNGALLVSYRPTRTAATVSSCRA